MLHLNNISATIGSTKILHNVTCTIETGDIIMLVGPNGAGKTTLFDIIAGHILPSGGKIILENTDITNWNEFKRAPFIGRLFQNPSLSCVPALTVEQNLALATYKGRRTTFAPGLKHFPKHLLEQVQESFNLNLKTMLHKPMRSLSGGQRQIISFIMATLNTPKLLLLDEPTAALDPASATKLLIFAHRYIKQHGITTLMITHDPNLAHIMGNKLWVIEHGTISKQFTGEQKKTLPAQDMIGHIDYNALLQK